MTRAQGPSSRDAKHEGSLGGPGVKAKQARGEQPVGS
jgi:hypothetical protein